MSDISTIKDTQQAQIILTYTDSRGNPASPPAVPPAFASSDSTIVSVDDTGLVKAVGPLGQADVTVTVVDDAGDTLTGIVTVNVVANSASTFKVVLGAAEEQPTT